MPDTQLPQFERRSACSACPLHAGANSIGIPTRWADWSLPPHPDIPAVLFVGQNPGFDEDRAGISFVGPIGHLAKYTYIGFNDPNRGSLGSGIYKRATVYLSNTARCGTWGGIEPTDKQYSTCVPYLLDDIKLIVPTCSRLLLVIMGAPAIKHTYKLLVGRSYGVKAAADRSGEVIDFGTHKLQLFSTYHPAYVQRKNAVLSAVIDHLRLVVDSLDGLAAVPSAPSFVSTSELIKIARSKKNAPDTTCSPRGEPVSISS